MYFLILLGAIVLWAIVIYNGFVRLKNRVDEAYADIDVQLKRRHNLIPNLVEAVKGYVKQEKSVLTDVTKARTSAMKQKGTSDKRADSENMLTGALKTLFAVSENYPDLKSNENFMELQRELSDTEDKIQAARRFYNSNVRDFNTKVESFPSNVIAGFFKFSKRHLFRIQSAEEAAPVKVKF